MNYCKVGLHKWFYVHEGNGRWCRKCQKRQEKNAAGTWIDSQPMPKPPKDEKKFCNCPRDYTISITTMFCQRCGLPRRPRA